MSELVASAISKWLPFSVFIAGVAMVLTILIGLAPKETFQTVILILTVAFAVLTLRGYLSGRYGNRQKISA